MPVPSVFSDSDGQRAGRVCPRLARCTMHTALAIALLLVLWLAWGGVVRWLLRGDVRARAPGDAFTSTPAREPGEELAIGVLYRGTCLYSRLVHRVRATQAPTWFDAHGKVGPLIIVANHSSSVDPLLVQACLPFEVRWMMGADMRFAVLEPVWTILRIISVDRVGVSQGKRDTRSLREAVAHLKAGGVVGIFPEGGINPPGSPGAYLPGAAMLAHLAKAPMQALRIEGAPYASSVWTPLVTPSQVRVVFGPRFAITPGQSPEAALVQVRAWITGSTG